MAVTSTAIGGQSRARAVATSQRRGRSHTRIWVAQIVVGMAILIGWWLAGTSEAARFYVGEPTSVFGRIARLAVSGELWTHFQATVTVALLGLVWGVVVGVAAGVVLGLSPTVAAILDPYVMFFYTLPRIALAPLFIMIFGVGPEGKAVFAFTVVVFIALLNAFEGVRSVDTDLVDALRTMQASRWYIIRRVVLPSIVPWILVTLRIGIGLATIGAIVAEGISASRGLGWYMTRSANTFDATGVFAAMIILSLYAIVVNACITLLEDRLLAWRR